MRYGERVEGCWEETVQQRSRGEIVGGHKHQAVSEDNRKGRLHLCRGSSSEQGKMMQPLPREYVVRNCLKLAMGFLDVCVRAIQREHVSLYFHSVLCSFQNLAF